MSKIGIILGSGLSGFKANLKNPSVVYSEKGGIHTKEVIEGKIRDKSVVVFTGRNHFYETYNSSKVFRNIDLAKDNNVDFLIITNAAGGLNPHYNVADLMLINSHFNFFKNRLIKNPIYDFDNAIVKSVLKLALKNNIKVHSGTYMASSGPCYETNAEIKFIRHTKADAVGMSTIPDILRAKELGMKVLGISCITNKLKADVFTEVTHDEVLAAGVSAYENFSNLLKLIINDY